MYEGVSFAIPEFPFIAITKDIKNSTIKKTNQKLIKIPLKTRYFISIVGRLTIGIHLESQIRLEIYLKIKDVLAVQYVEYQYKTIGFQLESQIRLEINPTSHI